jgi:acyl-coenzyme A synthetase/AMP-(fatty) acid ligase
MGQVTDDRKPRGSRAEARRSSSTDGVPTNGRTIAELAWRKRDRIADVIAFHEADRGSVTFGEIVTEAEELAAGMRAIGIQPGETISFQLPNWREAVAINLAATALGVRVNPITPIYRGAELRFILQDARSVLIFIPDRFRSIDYRSMLDELRASLPDLRHVLTVRGAKEEGGSYKWLRERGAAALPFAFTPPAPHSPKLLLYTSGTTGQAKGVVHTHDSLDHGTMSAVDFWEFGAGDNMLMPSPVTHITGYAFGLELPFQSDAVVTLMERWDPAQAITLIEHHQVTMSIGATPFLKELVDEATRTGKRLPTLRMFACGGAAVPPELILRTAKVTERCNAFRVYGATEIPLVTKGFCEPSERNLAAETDGRVVGYDIKIVDQDGATLERGRVGEIRARGPAMLVSYTNAVDFKHAIDEDGFFRTGDLGLLTESDAIVVTGRLKDIIIRGGENLSPFEIESALEQHPAVQEAAVVAMPHPRLGEGVAAFIRTVEGAELPTLTELADFLEESGLARQKFPERLEYIDDFPRTVSGKIRKDQLRGALRRPLVITLDQNAPRPLSAKPSMEAEIK